MSKIEKKKWLLTLGILFNVGILFYCKYYNFFISNISSLFHLDFVTKNIILPLGISFYTFQQIAYLAETYKRENRIGGFWDYVLYILYFPKLLMGPIVAPDILISQFHEPGKKKPNADNLVAGIQMFGYGLFKKVLIADTFATAVSWGFADLTIPTSGDFILIMLSYTFQIYFDFSGYSDMAIGISKMLNIDLPMNFDSPYKALSIRDFWKRWHISLTRFLTNYLYIPLGGNKKGKWNTYLNILIVFLVSGLWHGANWTFVLWGALHGLGSVMDRIVQHKNTKLPKACRWFITFILINVLWLLFRADTVADWILIIKSMASCSNMVFSDELIHCFCLEKYDLILRALGMMWMREKVHIFVMIAIIIFSFGICFGSENNYRRKKGSVWSLIFVLLAIIWSLIFIGTETIFIYSGF